MRARYILGEILTGLWRNVAMVISVVIVTAVSLTFVGAGLLMQKQIMDMKDTLVEQSQVTIFLCSPHSTAASCAGGAATDAQIDSVQQALEGDVLSPYIASYEERSQEEALAIYQEQFAGEGFVSNFTAEDMPVSFHITLKNADDPLRWSSSSRAGKGSTRSPTCSAPSRRSSTCSTSPRCSPSASPC